MINEKVKIFTWPTGPLTLEPKHSFLMDLHKECPTLLFDLKGYPNRG
jgi:hypothetical protein